jgi:hypothetical protein
MKRILNPSLPARWVLLTAVLAGTYVFIGLTSPPPSTRWPTLAGALLVLAALWLASRSYPAALTFLIIGAVVPAIIDWWSLVIPATALLILLCGTMAVRSTTAGNRPRPEPAATQRPSTPEG